MIQQVARLDSLTGVRAFAALWVVLHHYPFHKDIYPYSLLDFGLLTPLIHKGYLGVDLFFILSGFIISYVHQRHFAHWKLKQVGKFLCLRLARLYPVHIAMLFVGLCNFFLIRFLSKGALPEPKNMYLPEQFFTALLNVHAWGGGLSGGNWNGPSWSISAEWFAYLLFPVITAIFWAKPKSNLWFLAMLIPALCITCFLWGVSAVDRFVDSSALIRVMFGFSVGVLVYNFYKLDFVPHLHWDYGAIMCIGLLFIGLYCWPSNMLASLLFAPFLYCLSRSAGFMNRFFSHSVMVHLGEISYSIYLVHGIFLLGWTGIVMRRLLLPLDLGIEWHFALFFLSMVTVLGCAELMYRYVELPARNYLRLLIHRVFPEDLSESIQLSPNNHAPSLSAVGTD